MELFNKVTRIILILLVAVAILMQVNLYKTFLKNKEMLDADPLVYGANRFGIESCSCVLNENTEIIFNKNESRTIITQNGFGYNKPLNITWDK